MSNRLHPTKTQPAVGQQPLFPPRCQVFRATDGSAVELVKLWGPADKVVVAWTRSLGCPFCQEFAVQLRRDVKPRLDALGVNLLMVSIGEARGGGRVVLDL
jgi:hypothetical protein